MKDINNYNEERYIEERRAKDRGQAGYYLSYFLRTMMTGLSFLAGARANADTALFYLNESHTALCFLDWWSDYANGDIREPGDTGSKWVRP